MSREAPADGRVGAGALLGLMLLALAVRLPGLDAPLWFDEVWTLVDFVRRPLAETWSSYPSDNHHPLYTLLAGLCVRTLGEHPWTLRLPALVFGVLAVPALVLVGRRVVGARAALAAAFLLAISAQAAAYAQNARGYTALLFLVLAATHGFLACLDEGRPRAAVLLGVSLGLATWAHLTAVLAALAFGLVAGSRALARRGTPEARRARTALAGLLLAALVSLGLFAPMLPELLDFHLGRGPEGALAAEWKHPAWALSEAAAALLGRGGPWLGGAVLSAGLVVGGAGLVVVARRSPAAAWVFGLVPALTALALLLLGRNLWPRLFFQATGFGLLVLVAALAPRPAGCLPRPLAGLLGLLVVVALAAPLPRLWTLPKQDFAGARAWVEEHAGAADRVATVGLASFPYEAYYGGTFTAVESADELARLAREARTLYVLSTFPIYLRSRRPDVAAWLDEHATEAARFPGWVGDGDVVVLRAD